MKASKPVIYEDSEEEEDEYDSDLNVSKSEEEDIEGAEYINVCGRRHNIKSAVTKFCNGGRTIFGSRSRQSRFHTGFMDNKVGFYTTSCVEVSSCTVISVKDTVPGYFFPEKE